MKKQQTTFFIIPGFHGQTSLDRYNPLKALLKKKKGLVVKTPKVDWKYRVMSDYVGDFKEYFENHKSERNIVLGFSFGAMIAFISAQTLPVDRLYLC